MIIVIQCAARKRPDAGFLRTREGNSVLFVGDPSAAPPASDIVYARPDDRSDQEGSWRDVLLRYNRDPGNNSLGLSSAGELYANPAYERIARCTGPNGFYILSAGWGLIKASFLTPNYDITFSMVKPSERYKRRRTFDSYRDQRDLPDDASEPIYFFGGKGYVPLFCDLTRDVRGKRTVFYSSASPPNAPGCSAERFVTTTRTNWHYECVADFLNV